MPEDNGMTAQQDDEMTMTKAPAKRPAAAAGIASTVREKLGHHAEALRDQANAKAHDYAAQGKDKATELLDGLVELVDNAVSTLDRNFGDSDLGATASDYARRAAASLNDFNDTLRQKDVDDLLDTAKAAIRNNPAIAIGAAAAIGFVLARIVKSGTDEGAPASAADIKVAG